MSEIQSTEVRVNPHGRDAAGAHSIPPLKPDEVSAAMEEHRQNNMVKAYPRIDRFYEDPKLRKQKYCLHTFVPHVDAKPNASGIYGYMKCRGTFKHESDADTWAEKIIKTSDSYNSIFTARVGVPFAVGTEDALRRHVAKAIETTDVRRDMDETFNGVIHQKKEDAKVETKTAEQREAELREMSESAQRGNGYVPTPEEAYTESRVKLAHLTHLFTQEEEKLLQLQTSIRATNDKVMEMDSKPETNFSETFLARYMNAREAVGLPTKRNNQSDLINFLWRPDEIERILAIDLSHLQRNNDIEVRTTAFAETRAAAIDFNTRISNDNENDAVNE